MQHARNEIVRVIRSVKPTVWKQIGIGFVAFIIPLILFVQLADEVLERETIVVDEAVLRAINMFESPALDSFVVATTDLGYVWWVATATVVTILLCVRYKTYSSALITSVGVAGSAMINLLLKAMFQRDRPQLWERLVTENSFSFPSGHAMASASLATVIVIILWPTKWRWVAVTGAVGYVLYIGFTRMYLGVHYPTDIIAGWLVAVAWVGISAIIIKQVSSSRPKKS